MANSPSRHKFNLKQFREERNIAQGDFVLALGYSQAFISRIENDRKPVSDQLLMKIEEVYKINLDGYKKYDRNKKGLYPDSVSVPDLMFQAGQPETNLHPESAELKKQYVALLREKSELDQRYFALFDDHNYGLTLLQENNQLLKKIAADTEQIKFRMDILEKQKS